MRLERLYTDLDELEKEHDLTGYAGAAVYSAGSVDIVEDSFLDEETGVEAVYLLEEGESPPEAAEFFEYLQSRRNPFIPGFAQTAQTEIGDRTEEHSAPINETYPTRPRPDLQENRF